MSMKSIYMDVCCLNRPFDSQNHDRIHLEAEAVLAILSRCQNGDWLLAASDIIELEISKSKNHEKMEKVWSLYSLANQNNRLTVSDQVKERALTFQQHGIKLFDSLHLALAELSRQDVILTTDDSFLAAANKLTLNIMVANPVTWLMEASKNG